jgi:hypothetical protein
MINTENVGVPAVFTPDTDNSDSFVIAKLEQIRTDLI